MLVKVTLEFESADEAIVALGKLAGIRTHKNANATVEAGTKCSEVGSGVAGGQAAVTDAGKVAMQAANSTSTVPPAPPATRARNSAAPAPSLRSVADQGAIPAGTPAAAEPVKRSRKPRADKGQKREPYGKRTDAEDGTNATPGTGEKSGNASSAVTDPSKAAEKAANSTSTVAQAPAAATTVPSAPDVAPVPAASDVTPEAVQAAVEKLYGDKGYDKTLAALSRYGVKRGKDLPADQRANFIADVARILAGGAV